MPPPPPARLTLSITNSNAQLLPTGIFASASSHSSTLLLHTSRHQKHSPGSLDVLDAATDAPAFRIAARASGLRDHLVISEADGKELLALERLEGASGTTFVGHDPVTGLGLCAVRASGCFGMTLSLTFRDIASGHDDVLVMYQRRWPGASRVYHGGVEVGTVGRQRGRRIHALTVAPRVDAVLIIALWLCSSMVRRGLGCLKVVDA